MLTSAEFMELLVYAQLEPWGEERADLRMGILASTMANLWRGKDSRGYTPEDFMPRFGANAAPTPEETDAEIAAEEMWLEMMVNSMGGQVVEGEL
jgi:hypothetical protein